MGYPLRWEQVATPQFETETCEQEKKQRAPRRVSLRHYFQRLVLVTLTASAILVVSVVGVCAYLLTDRQPVALRLDAEPAGAVSAISPKVVRHLGYLVVTGRLANHSPAALTRVEAVVDLLDADQHTLSTQSAMVERESVTPGHEAGFKVEMPDSPAARGYRVHFRNLCGADLD